MFEHRYGKFTILKLKLSRLSYTAVEYFPFTIVICISKYDNAVDDSEVFLKFIWVFTGPTNYIQMTSSMHFGGCFGEFC